MGSRACFQVNIAWVVVAAGLCWVLPAAGWHLKDNMTPTSEAGRNVGCSFLDKDHKYLYYGEDKLDSINYIKRIKLSTSGPVSNGDGCSSNCYGGGSHAYRACAMDSSGEWAYFAASGVTSVTLAPLQVAKWSLTTSEPTLMLNVTLPWLDSVTVGNGLVYMQLVSSKLYVLSGGYSAPASTPYSYLLPAMYALDADTLAVTASTRFPVSMHTESTGDDPPPGLLSSSYLFVVLSVDKTKQAIARIPRSSLSTFSAHAGSETTFLTSGESVTYHENGVFRLDSSGTYVYGLQCTGSGLKAYKIQVSSMSVVTTSELSAVTLCNKEEFQENTFLGTNVLGYINQYHAAFTLDLSDFATWNETSRYAYSGSGSGFSQYFHSMARDSAGQLAYIASKPGPSSVASIFDKISKVDMSSTWPSVVGEYAPGSSQSLKVMAPTVDTANNRIYWHEGAQSVKWLSTADMITTGSIAIGANLADGTSPGDFLDVDSSYTYLYALGENNQLIHRVKLSDNTVTSLGTTSLCRAIHSSYPSLITSFAADVNDVYFLCNSAQHWDRSALVHVANSNFVESAASVVYSNEFNYGGPKCLEVDSSGTYFYATFQSRTDKGERGNPIIAKIRASDLAVENAVKMNSTYSAGTSEWFFEPVECRLDPNENGNLFLGGSLGIGPYSTANPTVEPRHLAIYRVNVDTFAEVDSFSDVVYRKTAYCSGGSGCSPGGILKGTLEFFTELHSPMLLFGIEYDDFVVISYDPSSLTAPFAATNMTDPAIRPDESETLSGVDVAAAVPVRPSSGIHTNIDINSDGDYYLYMFTGRSDFQLQRWFPACPIGYTFNSTTQQCSVCSAGSSTTRSGETSCSKCEVGYYAENQGVACKRCPRNGSTYNSGATTDSLCYCMKDFYGSSVEHKVECKACPRGGTCVGEPSMYMPIANYGYYVTEVNAAENKPPPTNTTEVLRCLPGYACRGGDATGKTGIVNVCDGMYTNSSDSACLECNPDMNTWRWHGTCRECLGLTGTSVVAVGLIALVVSVAVAVVVCCTPLCLGCFTPEVTTSVVIAVFYAQTFARLAKVHVRWPIYFDVIRAVQGLADLSAAPMLQLECFGLESTDAYAFSYLIRLLWPVLLPILAIPMLLVGALATLIGVVMVFLLDDIYHAFVAILLRRPGTGQRRAQSIARALTQFAVLVLGRMRKGISTAWNWLLLVVWLSYPQLHSAVFEAYSCTPQGSVYRLSDLPTVACYAGGSDEWWIYLFPVSLIGMIVYSLGIPILFTSLLLCNPRLWDARQVRRRDGVSTTDSGIVDDLYSRFTYFLWAPLDRHRRWWPLLELWLIRVPLGMLQLVANSNEPSDVLIINAMGVCTFLLISLAVKPYKTSRDTSMVMVLWMSLFVVTLGAILTDKYDEDTELFQIPGGYHILMSIFIVPVAIFYTMFLCYPCDRAVRRAGQDGYSVAKSAVSRARKARRGRSVKPSKDPSRSSQGDTLVKFPSLSFGDDDKSTDTDKAKHALPGRGGVADQLFVQIPSTRSWSDDSARISNGSPYPDDSAALLPMNSPPPPPDISLPRIATPQ